ncbi:PIN domain-containing protein [Micromonospora sp. NPDC048898]|uniref:PIN domain-containing protein n=1 Tax=Micromonospora sp. NPDC048898 TaxID=3364260 RepID=UPI003712218A
MFAALLDTCVLWPDLQRDFLLSLAIEGMYRPVWSSIVLEELEYEQRAKLIQLGEDAGEAAKRARHLVEQMRQHFDDAEVGGWEGLEGTYNLPDPDDEHLVAAAVVANTVALDPVRACAAVAAIARRSGRMGPVRTAEEILEILARRYGMTSAVEVMRQAAVDTLHVRPPQPRVSQSEQHNIAQGLNAE